MNPNENFPAPFRLRAWLVQPELNRISGPVGEHQIEPRVMDVLLALAAVPGRVVAREQLLDTVWKDAVVGEEILTRAVSELRRVLGDDPRRPLYIETIRQHGYRLIAPVEAATEEPAATGPVPPPPAPPVPPESVAQAAPRAGAAHPEGASAQGASRLRPWLTLVTVLVALTLLAVAGRRALRPDASATPAPAPATAVPLTSLPGREMHPALTADGGRVAFVWAGDDGRSPGVYVKQRGSEAVLRLTAEPGWPAWPCWSPDGLSVAFVQTGDSTSALCRVASLGGAVERLLSVTGLIEGVDWSPDGRRIVFAAAGESGLYGLRELDLATRAVTRLPAAGADDAVLPRYAPDGDLLAWIAVGPAGEGRVLVGERGDTGAARVTAAGLAGLQGLAWTADGAGLVYAAAPSGTDNLWRVPREGGTPAWIPTAGELVRSPAVARGTGDLAYEQVRLDRDLWRVEVVGRDPWRLSTGPFLTSTRWEYGADFDPAGRRLVFVSARSGRPALWLAAADGRDVRRLGDFEAAAITNPRWSPDGRWIACNAMDEQGSAVIMAPAGGGAVRRVELAARQALFTSWSADGMALLLGIDAGDGWQIGRWDPRDGSLRLLTSGGGITAAETPAGDLYHTRPDRPGLWRLPAGAGPDREPEAVLPDLAPHDRQTWRLGPGWIAWVMRSGGAAFLMRHDLATGRSDFVAELPGLAGPGLAADPDGNTFLYSRSGQAAGDLMLIEGGGR